MSDSKKILIVDDEEDLRELLIFMIESDVKCEIFEATTGNEAIAWMKENPFDVIFCDYNMPDGNGGDVFKYMLENNLTQPYIMVSSDRPGDYPVFSDFDMVHSLLKPFDETDLKKLLNKVELISTDNDNDDDNLWASIRVCSIEKFDKIFNDLYLKLSDEKYIKLINKDQGRDRVDFAKYKDKGVSHFYIKKSEVNSFIKSYTKNILTKNYKKRIEIKESYEVLESTIGIVRNLSQSFGWTEDVKNLANENINYILNDLNQRSSHSEDLKNLFNRIINDPHSDFASHSTGLVYICTGLAFNLGWTSDFTNYKLAMASLIHDASLTDLQVSNELDYVLALTGGVEGREIEDLDQFRDHPIRSAEISKYWPMAHPDVDTIILEHHERPDSKGFPNGRSSSEISPLACLFIVAEDLYNEHRLGLLQGSSLDLPNFLNSREKVYNSGHFKKVLEGIKNNLSTN